MPKTKISDYSQTAASNTDINSINLGEGMLPSDVNNAIRELMKQLKDFQVGAQGDGATFSSLNLTTTALTVPNGGTGATSFTSGEILKGAGTSAVTTATAGTDYAKPNTASTWTAAQTFRAANAVRSEAASTQDAIVLAGRAGGTGSFAVTLTPNTLSANRTVTFPDAATNIPIASQTLTFSGPTAARTYTLPDSASTLAALGTAQTFTAAQTFRAANAIRSEAASTQDAVVVAGRAGGTSSYAVTMTPTTLSANRTLTLPDATTTVVGTDTTQTLTNKTLTDPTIVGAILEDVFTITDGAAFEIDPGNGSIQLITLGASRTPKATNFAAGESVTLMVDDGTAYTITWTDTTFGTSGVVWKTNGGVAPTLNTSGYTVITLWKVGTQVYGARVGDA